MTKDEYSRVFGINRVIVGKERVRVFGPVESNHGVVYPHLIGYKDRQPFGMNSDYGMTKSIVKYINECISKLYDAVGFNPAEECGINFCTHKVMVGTHCRDCDFRHAKQAVECLATNCTGYHRKDGTHIVVVER